MNPLAFRRSLQEACDTIRGRAGVSSSRPYRVCVALPLRVHPEVSQAGAARGNRGGGAGSDSGNLSEADIEILQGHIRPDHVHLLLSVPPTWRRAGSCRRSRAKRPTISSKIAAAAGGVLGPAPVGSRLLRVQQRPSDGRGDCPVYPAPRGRAPRRRPLSSQRDVSLHGAAMASLQSTSVDPESLAFRRGSSNHTARICPQRNRFQGTSRVVLAAV